MSERVQGHVVRMMLNEGSKSEHEGVVLHSDKGSFELRRKGANPFSDPGLDELVGKSIVAEGDLHQSLLLLDSWQPHKS